LSGSAITLTAIPGHCDADAAPPPRVYDLLTLLDIPEVWDDRDRFVEFFETRQALSTVLEDGADLSSRPKSSGPSQATLDGKSQDRFDASIEYADVVLEGLVDDLGLDSKIRWQISTATVQYVNGLSRKPV
jgi:hypothetical protein